MSGAAPLPHRWHDFGDVAACYDCGILQFHARENTGCPGAVHEPPRVRIEDFKASPLLKRYAETKINPALYTTVPQAQTRCEPGRFHVFAGGATCQCGERQPT